MSAPSAFTASARHLLQLAPSLKDYSQLKRTWRTDLLAGITVGIVALPLALAFGVSSGVGAAAGLVTAVVAGLVAAVFGGSHVQVSGPTGAMVVILAPIVAVHGTSAVALLTIMSGFLVLALGIGGLGRAVSLIPWPVVEGFTLGIAIIIALQQVPLAVGSAVVPGHNSVVAAFTAVTAATWPRAGYTLAIVALVALVAVVGPRIHPQFPASLIAVVLATIAASWVKLPVPVIGQLPQSLPLPHLPNISVGLIISLSPAAFAVALLAAIESLLSARVAASLAQTGSYHPDRELVGQGLASMASGLFGGMPATGAIARTAVNVRSGAHTRVSAIIHAIILMLVVYLASNWVSQIPLAALAGVLFVTATRMFSWRTAKAIVTSTKSDATVFLVTAVITVSFDLIQAIGIGVLAAAFFALRNLARHSGVVRLDLPGQYQDGDDHIALFRLDGAMFFGAAERVSDEVARVHHVQVVIISMSHVGMLDASGAHGIVDLVTVLEGRGITVLLKGLQAQHFKVAKNVGLVSSLRHHKHLFDDLDQAVAHARSHIERWRSSEDIGVQS